MLPPLYAYQLNQQHKLQTNLLVDSVRGNLQRTGSVQNFKEFDNDSLAKWSVVGTNPKLYMSTAQQKSPSHVHGR